MRWTLAELAAMLGAELHGPADMTVTRLVSFEANASDGIAFCETAKHLHQAEGVGVVLVPFGLSRDAPFIAVDNPRQAFEMLMRQAERPVHPPAGIHPTAVVEPGAVVAETASIGAFSVVAQGATIGDGVKVFAHCYIGHGCTVGSGTILYPRVTLYHNVHIGARNVVHSGAVIGATGFGLSTGPEGPRTLPHLGTVRTGENVEIGANTCLDRATLGETTVESGSRIDNLVQVGHNVRVGNNAIVCGQAGIAGSAVLGDEVIVGGAVGIADHVTIAGGTRIAGGSIVLRDVRSPETLWGYPARPHAQALRTAALLPHLAELFHRVTRLERRASS